MPFDRKYLQEIIDGVDERVQATRKAIAEGIEGPPLGASGVSDEDFRAFVEMKVAANPNWILALPFVEGGPQLLTRFERITGLRDE